MDMTQNGDDGMTTGGKAGMRSRSRQTVFAGALLVTSALVPVLIAAPAMAQQQVGQSGAGVLGASHAFEIPAQSMTSALTQFG